jgi:hypothetical protein
MVVERIRHGKPFYEGDAGHSSHRLIKVGFSNRSMLIIPSLVGLSAGALALSFPKLKFHWQLIFSCSGFFLLVLMIYLLSQIRVYDDSHAIDDRDSLNYRRVRRALKTTAAIITAIPVVAWIIVWWSG